MSSGYESGFKHESRYPISDESPFKALRIFSVVITVIAILTAFGFGFACVSVFRSQALILYGSMGILIVGLVALIGAIATIFLLAIAESIKVFLAIESNTRNSMELLRKRSAERHEITTPVQN